MDNFTKGLLERNEKRNKMLGIPSNKNSMIEQNERNNINFDKENNKKNDSQTASPVKIASFDKETIGKTFSTNKEAADVAVEISINSKQNIQVEIEVAECEYDDNGTIVKKGETFNYLSNSSNNVKLRDHSRKNLKRLGVLYSETDQISSPIQRTEENFCEPTNVLSHVNLKKYSKLTALANEINNWDDDYTHHKNFASPSKGNSNSNKPNTSSPLRNQTTRKISVESVPDKIRNFVVPSNKDSKIHSADKSSISTKNLIWDKKVIDSLEAQGFSRRESNVSKLEYDYSKAEPSTSGMELSKKKSLVRTPEKSLPNLVVKKSLPKLSSLVNNKKGSSVSSSNKSSEQQNLRFSNNFIKNQKDPAEMSLKERMAIFEKNKGKAPVPKTLFGTTDTNPIRSNINELSKKYDFGFKSPGKIGTETTKVNNGEKAAMDIKSAVNKLLSDRETTISEKQICDEIKKQRAEDMKCIMNRYNQHSDKPNQIDHDEMIAFDEKSDRKRRSSSENFTDQPNCLQNKELIIKECKFEDKKRARMSNTHRLYPVLSDIESTTDSEADNCTTATVSCTEDDYYAQSSLKATSNEPETSTDEDEMNLNLSIGRELLNKVRKSADLENYSYMESTMSSQDKSDAICDMDDYLNEALDDSKNEYDDKGSACSDSFEYERYPKRVSFKNTDIPIKSKVEICNDESSKGSMTLVHTISFYRRQQSASASNTPIKKSNHKTDETVEKNETINTQLARKAKEECENKIQRLLDEVIRQQTIISQASQALTLCASTFEFSGSTEAVEGERHLIVSINRRLACLNEVQRLKVEGLVDRFGTAKEKGILTISEIIIPLKQSYISRLATDEIAGHHLLCLVKYNEYVLATKTHPTLPGLKSVKFNDILTFNEVYTDFKITLEIYGMTAQREVIPHDIKYHIQTPNKKKFKNRLQESNLVSLPTQSPAGPNAVRTPALVKYGYIIFSLREIKQKSWVINETAAGVSPLNGNVYLKIDSKITVDVNHCGFLTMFDDISGFGAWHRRWCRLSGNILYYWKYPEDEKRKESLGQLDLKSIITTSAVQAPRTVCSRLNTILLESKREKQSDDKASLVCVPKENYTLVRHLLAADTKEEREEWCEHFNKSLSLLKSWSNTKH